MSVRQIAYDDSLASIREELVYTRARLQADPRTRTLATAWAKLIERQTAVANEQQGAWDAEVVAQAGVDFADDVLDEVVDAVDGDLLRLVHDDRTDPRYTRYFAVAPNEILRLGLENELGKVREWPASLERESDKAVKAHAKPLAQAVEHGDEALAQRRKALSATADQRVHEIVRFVDDVNGARVDLYAKLLTLGREHDLASYWALQFFKRAARTPRAKKPAKSAPPTPTSGAAG